MPVLLLSNDVRFVYLLVGYHSAVLSVKVYCCLYNTLVRIVRRTAVVYYSFCWKTPAMCIQACVTYYSMKPFYRAAPVQIFSSHAHTFGKVGLLSPNYYLFIRVIDPSLFACPRRDQHD